MENEQRKICFHEYLRSTRSLSQIRVVEQYSWIDCFWFWKSITSERGLQQSQKFWWKERLYLYARRSLLFNNFIYFTGLVDLNICGERYIWMSPDGSKFSKFDKFILFVNFWSLWPNSNFITMSKLYSNHCPLLFNKNNHDYGLIPFRFFNSWLCESDLESLVRNDGWNLWMARTIFVELKFCLGN